MRYQPAQITEVIVGPTELFVSALQDMRSTPVQQDDHCKGWRWEMYLQSAKRAEAAVREEVRRINAERRARINALQNELTQLAAE